MTKEIKIGKIESVKLGFGGYQNVMFGLTISFSDAEGSFYVEEFIGTWSYDPPERAEWTKESQGKIFADVMFKIIEICKKANVDDFTKLQGCPVEICLNGDRLNSWRILE